MWGFTTVEVCVLSVSTALARLQDGLGESFPDLPGTRIIDVAFPLNDAFDPLLWCGQQAQWPQFYWQQRNGDEELATLGAVKTFTSLDAANRFLRQVGRQDLRICGLNAFEPQQAAWRCRVWSGAGAAAGPCCGWCCIVISPCVRMPRRPARFSPA